VWEALVDPALVARFTPFVRRITASGEHWSWALSGLTVAGVGIAPEFTEAMTFVEPERIEFRHDPPAGVAEKAGVAGFYELSPVEGGTRLRTEMSISVDLPLPRVAGAGVRAAMGRVIALMGERFSANLLAHLGARRL
jgi:carbon monoxide dehydrogenase subunit G